MNTIKYYMKIARQNKTMLLLYIIILVSITAIQGMSYEEIYNESEINIGVIKNDDSQFANSLINYLEKENSIYYYDSVDLAELDLYTRYIDGILEIPENSEGILLNSNNAPLKIYTDITNPQSRIFGSVANKYPMYYKSMFNSKDLDIDRLFNVLDEKAKIEFIKPQVNAELKFFGYVNAYGFVIMMILLKLLGDLHLSFNKRDIQIRSDVSPKNKTRINMELNFSQILISALVFIIVFSIGIFGFFPEMLKAQTLKYYVLILTLWTLVVVFFSSFVNRIGTSKAVTNMMSNALPVMLMFLSGSAIPIEIMPKFVQGVAKFSPLFYYNNAITKLSTGNLNIKNEVFILIAFSIAFYVTGLYLGKAPDKK